MGGSGFGGTAVGGLAEEDSAGAATLALATGVGAADVTGGGGWGGGFSAPQDRLADAHTIETNVTERIMGSSSSRPFTTPGGARPAVRGSRVELIAIEFASVDTTVRPSTLALFCIRFSDAHELRSSVDTARDAIGFAARVSFECDSVVAFHFVGFSIDTASEGAAAGRRRDESAPVALDHGLMVYRAGERALSLARVVWFAQRSVTIEPSRA
jgi:hypothetical protein